MIWPGGVAVEDIANEFGRPGLRVDQLSDVVSKEAVFNASGGQRIGAGPIIVDDNRSITIVVVVTVIDFWKENGHG